MARQRLARPWPYAFAVSIDASSAKAKTNVKFSSSDHLFVGLRVLTWALEDRYPAFLLSRSAIPSQPSFSARPALCLVEDITAGRATVDLVMSREESLGMKHYAVQHIELTI